MQLQNNKSYTEKPQLLQNLELEFTSLKFSKKKTANFSIVHRVLPLSKAVTVPSQEIRLLERPF